MIQMNTYVLVIALFVCLFDCCKSVCLGSVPSNSIITGARGCKPFEIPYRSGWDSISIYAWAGLIRDDKWAVALLWWWIQPKSILTLFGMSAQSAHLLCVIKKPRQTDNIPLTKAPIATVCHAQCFCVSVNDLGLVVENADMGFCWRF